MFWEIFKDCSQNSSLPKLLQHDKQVWNSASFMQTAEAIHLKKLGIPNVMRIPREFIKSTRSGTICMYTRENGKCVKIGEMSTMVINFHFLILLLIIIRIGLNVLSNVLWLSSSGLIHIRQ